MRLALRIAYDGTCFHGSARQPSVATVEGAIIEQLIEMDAIDSAADAKFQAASRTDAGVSAAGNVVAFDTDMAPGSVASGLAHGLAHIWPLRYAIVDEGFAPRHAVRKTYRYYLYDSGYDREAMRQAAGYFEGRHDVSAFARLDGRSPVREIEQVAIDGDAILAIDVVGKSFLWQQVRRMVAGLEQVGRGTLRPGTIRDALQQPAGQDFGIVAPEQLLLLDIEYGVALVWNEAPRVGYLEARLQEVQLRMQMYGDMAHSSSK